MSIAPLMKAGAAPLGRSGTSASRSNTSNRRSLATAPRWTRLTMKPATRNGCTTMLTYMKKATKAPGVISPLSTKCPP